MKFGLIGLLSSIVALPMAYLPFKYLFPDVNVPEQKERSDHDFKEQSIDLDIPDWINWIQKSSWNDSDRPLHPSILPFCEQAFCNGQTFRKFPLQDDSKV